MADYNYSSTSVIPQQSNYSSYANYGASDSYAPHATSSFNQPAAQSYTQTYSSYDQLQYPSAQGTSGAASAQPPSYTPSGIAAANYNQTSYGQTAAIAQPGYSVQTYSQQSAAAAAAAAVVSYGQQQVQTGYQTATAQYAQYPTAQQPTQQVTYVVQDQTYVQHPPSYGAQVAVGATYAQPQTVLQSAYGQPSVQTVAYAAQAAGTYAQGPPPTYGQTGFAQSANPTAVAAPAYGQQPSQAAVYGQQPALQTYDSSSAPPGFSQVALATGVSAVPPPTYGQTAAVIPQGVPPVQGYSGVPPPGQNLIGSAANPRGLAVGGPSGVSSLVGPGGAPSLSNPNYGGGPRTLPGPAGFGGAGVLGRFEGPPADMMLEAPDTVHIAGLPEDINEEQVADFFGNFGPLKIDKRTGRPCIYVPRDRMTGRTRGEASVSFIDPQAAEQSTRFFFGKDFRGRQFSVSISDGRGGRIPITANMIAPNIMRDGPMGGGGGGNVGGGRSGGSSSVGGRSGDWTCVGCGNQNFAWRNQCNRCKEPKELMARDNAPSGMRDGRSGGMRGGGRGGGPGGRNQGSRDGGNRGPGNRGGGMNRGGGGARGGGPMKGRDDKDRKNRPY